MQQYAVVFFPQIDLEKIQILRKKYDPMFGVLPPHITVIFPFSDISEEEMVTHLPTVTKGFSKFSIRLNGFTKSSDNYLFLLVKEGKEDIQRLHDHLYSRILAKELHNDIPFIPHITLGDFSNNNFYKKALAEAEGMDIDIACTFDKITLIKGDGISPAAIIQNFDLKQ